MNVVLDHEFTEGKTVVRDARGRVALGSAASGRRYAMSINRHGQILLTPVVEIPEHEMWLWNSAASLAEVRNGLADALEGRIQDLGSFANSEDDGAS